MNLKLDSTIAMMGTVPTVYSGQGKVTEIDLSIRSETQGILKIICNISYKSRNDVHLLQIGT